MNKKELRGEMRARRRQLPEREQREAAQAVFERLLAFEPYQRAKTVMAYMACRGELDLGLVIEDALKSGRTLLERVPGEAHDIQMDYVITPGGIIRTGQEAKDDGRT